MPKSNGSTSRYEVAHTLIILLSRAIERSNADAPLWEASSLSRVRPSHWPASSLPIGFASRNSRSDGVDIGISVAKAALGSSARLISPGRSRSESRFAPLPRPLMHRNRRAMATSRKLVLLGAERRAVVGQQSLVSTALYGPAGAVGGTAIGHTALAVQIGGRRPKCVAR